MKKTTKTIIIILVIAFAVLCVLAAVGDENNVAKEILSFIGAGAFLIVGFVVYALFSGLVENGSANHTHKERDSGMISCKKCGYLGVGHGFCPRCGWNRIEKITSGSSMISCMKCGYLGVGYGSCPRCGWNRIRKITK